MKIDSIIINTPILDIDFDNMETLGKGGDGIVKEVSSKQVFKLFCTYKEPWNSMFRDYTIHHQLFMRGHPVPYPFGFFKIKTNSQSENLSDKYKPGILMQKIKGVGYDDLKQEDYPYFNNLYEKSIEGCKKDGFLPKDVSRSHNTLFVPEKKKLYLIDFMQWRKKSKFSFLHI